MPIVEQRYERSQKYRSTNVYTSDYIRHHTVQCEVSSRGTRPESNPPVGFGDSGATSRVAPRFGSDKLYMSQQ